MLTKTQIKIMELFTSKINERFSINQIANLLKKPYPLIHRSIKSLISEDFLIKDNKELLYLNYKSNLGELTYIETIRKNSILAKDKILSLFLKDSLEKIHLLFPIILLFGSYMEKKSPRDIDILIIIDNSSKITEIEKTARNIASNFTKDFDINVISIESAEEMISKRDKLNVMNETLNNHILLFGAENYYKILKNAR
ncbi:MAG: hypothetical protein AABX48_02930 [Nanoarchaeota archaeon]